jgi:hypothetical protein
MRRVLLAGSSSYAHWTYPEGSLGIGQSGNSFTQIYLTVQQFWKYISTKTLRTSSTKVTVLWTGLNQSCSFFRLCLIAKHKIGECHYPVLAWYSEFLLEIDLKSLLRKQEQDWTSRLHLYLRILTLVPHHKLTKVKS